MKVVNIIGGGLAGCEAAWQLANKGINVEIYEMRDKEFLTPAHKTDILAELVCSNSFRNDDDLSAIGLLHKELRALNSLIMESADLNKVPAGSALAMDREGFSNYIQNKITSHPNIKLIRKEILKLPNDNIPLIVASGPLTGGELADDIKEKTGTEYLSFFDAIAPIIYKDSINLGIAWYQSRYDKMGPGGSGKDYINCPLNKEEYYDFVDALISAPKMEFKEWEKNTPYFNGCLPIEVMAERGKDTLRFGPMKPVGLINPNTPEMPYAVVQLRQDNKLGTLYNIVGFQTKLKYPEQTRIFKMIPGLENAEFARLGGMHRNSFIKSPIILDEFLSLKTSPNIKFAGQITGVEGYVESSAIGLLAGIFTANEIYGIKNISPPNYTAIGALLNHIINGANAENFQPMNINYGLFPEIKAKKANKKELYRDRAFNKLNDWIKILKESEIYADSTWN